MGYWGTGAPTVKLLDNEGTQVEAVVLPTPTERLVPDEWIPEFEDPGTTLNYDDASERIGYRFQAKYFWRGVSSTDMTKLLKVLNWNGRLRLWPHKDATGRVVVRAGVPSYGHPLGRVTYDEITLEFIGVHLMSRVPDPATDIVLKPYRRATLQTAEQSES